MPPPPPPVTPVVKTAKGREPIPKSQTRSIPGNKSTPTPGTRPTIRLKIGSGTHDNGPVNGTGAETPSRPKKPPVESTPSKPPPPPKPAVKEEPKASVKLKTNGVSHNNKGEKRKKTLDAIFSDDDILASAAPLKKRPSPLLGATTGGPSTPSPAPSQLQRNGSSVLLKLKAPKPAPSPPTLPHPEPSPPSEPIRNGKGKEPEVRGASVGPKPKVPASAAVNVKRCKDVMKTLQKIPDSVIFARPVDPIADGCPTYVNYHCIASVMVTLTVGPHQVLRRDQKPDGLWYNQPTSQSKQV
jgi:transcription initiation factor TFIID subunit 2